MDNTIRVGKRNEAAKSITTDDKKMYMISRMEKHAKREIEDRLKEVAFCSPILTWETLAHVSYNHVYGVL